MVADGGAMMIDLDRLGVSLTKNGYLKIAELVKAHSRFAILDNCEGVHPGINIVPNQVFKILSADPRTGDVPEVWDEIREYGDAAIECFTLVAVIFSHARLIDLFQRTSQGAYLGHVDRADLPQEKEYQNLVYAMASLNLCDYLKGSQGVNYDFRPLVHALRDAGPVVKKLLELKLRTAGWRDPALYRIGADGDFWTESQRLALHSVFGMEPAPFRRWLSGPFRDMDRVSLPRRRNIPR